MQADVLHTLTDSIDRREAVALVTVTAATGVFAAANGNHAVVWPQPDRLSVGKLDLAHWKKPH